MKNKITEYNEYLKDFGKNDFIYIESIEIDFTLTQLILFENINSIKSIYYITNDYDFKQFIQATCRSTITNFPSITWTDGSKNFSFEEIKRKRNENDDIDLVIIEDFNKLIEMELERKNLKDNNLIRKQYLGLFKEFNCPIIIFEDFAFNDDNLFKKGVVKNIENYRPILKDALNYYSKVKALVNKNDYYQIIKEPFYPLYYDCYDVKDKEISFISLIECYNEMKYVLEGNNNEILLDFIGYRKKAELFELDVLDCNDFALNRVKENLNARKQY